MSETQVLNITYGVAIITRKWHCSCFTVYNSFMFWAFSVCTSIQLVCWMVFTVLNIKVFLSHSSNLMANDKLTGLSFLWLLTNVGISNVGVWGRQWTQGVTVGVWTGLRLHSPPDPCWPLRVGLFAAPHVCFLLEAGISDGMAVSAFLVRWWAGQVWIRAVWHLVCGVICVAVGASCGGSRSLSWTALMGIHEEK